jgi:Ser/Thr protein kinase RdoA (MazF antagonist)
LVGRFHTIMLDFKDGFSSTLPHFHDTFYHISKLAGAFDTHKNTLTAVAVRPMVELILEQAQQNNWTRNVRARAAHGDLKLSNFRFDSKGRNAIALIDFDTVGKYPLAIELGDLLRSFSAVPRTTVPKPPNSKIWFSTLKGYQREASFTTSEERKSVIDGFEQVTVELAARWIIKTFDEFSCAQEVSVRQIERSDNCSRAASAVEMLRGFYEERDFYQEVTELALSQPESPH